MDSGQCILPGELAALAAFVLAPPALVVLAIQAWFLRRQGIFRRKRGTALLALSATLVLGVGLVALAFLTGPPSWGQWLGLHDVVILGQGYPVSPFAAVALAVAAVITTHWARRSGDNAV